MTDSDDYRIVEIVLRGVRPQSIFVDRPNRQGEVSIPRSLLHAADDTQLDGRFAGEKITVRLRAWKAEELGFA